MDTYGLIGKKLTHSFSPDYFNKKFKELGINARYLLYDTDDVLEIKNLIRDDQTLKGLNITIPYKKSVFEIADEIDPVAAQVGSVNTLKIDRTDANIAISAFNTDVIGFEQTLLPLVSNQKNIDALVLGTGGAANAVEFVLNKLQIPFSFVSRNPLAENQISYSTLSEEIIKSHKLIINTTPKGMFPDVGESPAIPYQFIDKEHVLYDLIYNPKETLFLQRGREKGCVTMNGLKMLEIQADASWELWSHNRNLLSFC